MQKEMITWPELEAAWRAIGADTKLYQRLQQQIRKQRQPTQIRAPIARSLFWTLEEEVQKRLPGFTPSSYQLDIFRFLLEGNGDGIVNAVAGSGKSTTLLNAAKLVEGDVLFAAFNSHIAKELQDKITERRHTARTLHSIGHGCLARHIKRPLKIEERKYRQICWRVVPEKVVPQAGQQQRKAVDCLVDLAKFARLTLADEYEPEALQALIAHFGIEVEPELVGLLLEVVPEVLLLGAKIAEKQGIIDYPDQIYLPHVFCLEPTQVPWVFVDEAQDLNAAQLEIALKCRAPGGRMLFVGDDRQAIYGFTGADSESISRIRTRTGSRDLPLSICYRCPKSHVRLAQEIVPQIEPKPAAKEGIIAEVKRVEIGQTVQAQDLVLCRKMAPLIELCIELIEHRHAATVRGRNLSHALTDIVEDVEQLPDYSGYGDFAHWLAEYERLQITKLAQHPGSEDRVQQIEDRCRAVLACYRAYQIESAEELCKKIAGLFSDERTAVYLSTVHRAKGLQAQRVFILEPENLPLVWEKQQEWQAEQELNLKYVALTRATEALYFIK
jgi:superfamily I DNA/RNA helicase